MTRTDEGATSDDLRLSTRDNVLIAEPVVEVDMSNAEQLGGRIAEAVTTGCRGVVIDLAGVDYLDSFGLCVLVGLAQQFTHRDLSTVLVAPADSPVLPTLRVSNVHGHLRIVEGVDQAVGVLTARPVGL